MIRSASLVREFTSRVRIQFDGYEGVIEVFLDSGVQRFVRALTELFPYWLHFADKDDDTLRLLISCLLPPQIESAADGNPQMKINVAAWQDQLARLHRYMRLLHGQFGLTQEETLAISDSVATWATLIGLEPI
jgi:hypothetical protein